MGLSKFDTLLLDLLPDGVYLSVEATSIDTAVVGQGSQLIGPQAAKQATDTRRCRRAGCYRFKPDICMPLLRDRCGAKLVSTNISYILSRCCVLSWLLLTHCFGGMSLVGP